MLDTALELYNNLLNIFKTQYDKLTKSQKKKIKAKNIPVNLAIELYLYEDEWFIINGTIRRWWRSKTRARINYYWKNKIKSTKKTTKTWLKVLTLNKLLTRLPIILAQTKTENNSAKLKNKIRKANTISWISATKSL